MTKVEVNQNEKIEVVVTRIIVKREGFMIVSGTDLASDKPVTLVGNFYVIKGEKMYAEGEWQNNSYGPQFKVKKYEVEENLSKTELIDYLKENYRNIGKTRAKEIVEAFGDNTLEVIKNDYEQLINIGIPEDAAYDIHSEVVQMDNKNNLVRFLTPMGFSFAFAQKILDKWGTSAIDKIKNNPFCLYTAELVEWEQAEFMAKKLGIVVDDACWIEGIITSELRREAKSGNCYDFVDSLISKVSKKCPSVEKTAIVNRIYNMWEKRELVIEDDKTVFIPELYYAERYSAKKFRMMLDTISEYKIKHTPEEIFEAVQKETGAKYASQQELAIKTAMQKKVMVLTGGPGTGKTTTVNSIIKGFYYNDPKTRLLCAAPTGKASKRMEEATGQLASTIHRMLEFKPVGESLQALRNEKNPIEADVIIIDEFSMVDIELLKMLLNALSPYTRLILVGDVNQLPSVGPGNVLADIINSEVVPTVRLTEVFRQAADSPIVSNAYKINECEMPVFNNSDFTLDSLYEADEEIANAITSAYADLLANGESTDTVQVLTPMRKKTACGSRSLNKLIQDIVNPYKGKDAEIKYFFGDGSHCCFRVGDKVIQMKNNYEKNCFNGDTGYIKSIAHDTSEKIVVLFDNDNEIEFVGREEIMQLDLAYALTIHKSQGSEYPIVLMPLCKEHKSLSKNLLYTGVTRAKKKIHLFGTEKTCEYGVKNIESCKRRSKLAERII